MSYYLPLAGSQVSADGYPIKFVYHGGFPAGQTDVEVFDLAGDFQRIKQPSPGSIVRAAIQIVSPRTAGTLTAYPTVNGVKNTTYLNLVLNASFPSECSSEILNKLFTFQRDDKIGCMFTSDGSWAPITESIEYTLWVLYNM
jgi:hypothetical protein